MSGNTVELDKKFSTTRRVIKKYQSTDDRQDYSPNNYTLLPEQIRSMWRRWPAHSGLFKKQRIK